jgi:hypothetical protein
VVRGAFLKPVLCSNAPNHPLTIGYQNIVNYYDEEIARAKMVQGEAAFTIFRDQWNDLESLRKAFFESGIEMKKVLNELTSYIKIEKNLTEHARTVSVSLRAHYQEAWKDETIGSFVKEVGIILYNIARFMERVSDHYGFGISDRRPKEIASVVRDFRRKW